MMADFVVPRHSAVMERLRRRIELFRRHHNSCENRYENTALERLELERQQTFALHQRCLQTKAKRSNKHRQPQQSSDQAGQRGPVTGVSTTDLGDGGTAGEQSRNSTLIAETVKRKLESASSPLGRDQVNGFSDGYPPSKKSCLDNGTINGMPPHSPMDTKHGIGVAAGIGDSLVSNGTHGPAGESGDCSTAEQEFRLKEMKQEPVDDILPCMLPTGGAANNSLFPDLNLNEQEWTELMEELNRSVAYEDIEEILNDGFEDRKEPPELAPTPGTGVSGAGSSGGGGGGTQVQPGQPSQGLLPPDLASIKAEFSPASAAFEQDSRTGSPHVRPTSSAPPVHSTNSPAATSTASSPALPQPQQSQQPTPSRQLQPPNHLLQPGPPVSKDLSPAQHLQQLAAQQQRVQQMQNQLQQQQQKQQQVQKQQQQQAAKFHPQGSHPHPPSWPQTANPSQSPLGGAFAMDKPSSPSLYPQDFNPNNPKQLMMPGQPNKGSPKAGAGPYMQGSVGHPNMLGHSASGAPLSHPSSAGAQPTPSMLSYNNTKPLSHFEAMGPGSGPPRGPPNTQSQNKAALLSLLRQQQMKNKAGMAGFRPHLPHAQQEQSAYTTTSHGPGSGATMTSQPGGNAMAGNHGNAAYLNSQAAVAAALKQQQQQQHQQQQMQMLEQQKQYLLGQRQQQMMVEQEKQRQQQEQQMQRHLTRPPPQYQDQQGQTATQNPFQQQPVNQFPGSSQPVGNVGSMGGPAPGAQRMFPQNQGIMGLNMGQGSGPAGGGVPPPAASQADMNLPSCGGGAGMDVQQVLYSNMNMHPSHPGHPPHPSQQGNMQRQPVGAMNANYRQNLLAQQQHLKNQPNAALLKQQQLAAAAAAARLPGSLPNSIGANMPNAMPSAMQSAQSQAWQQQQQQQQQQHQGLQQAMSSQPPSSNGGMPPNAFTGPNAFHMQQQQTRMPKMPTGSTPFGTNPNGRPMGGMNPRQQMMQTNMATQQRVAPNPQTLGQPLGQPLPNQQSQQTQQQQQQAAQNQGVLPDLGAFGQPQGNSRQGLQCNQGFQVNRTANQQQQQQQQQQPLSFGYNAASGTGGLPSFPGESDLVDSLLKSQSTQEWMDDLDELLASHH